jgi:hypothetical protein
MVTQVQKESPKSFKEIALASKLADATIRNAYKIIQGYKYDLLGVIASKEMIDKRLPQL